MNQFNRLIAQVLVVSLMMCNIVEPIQAEIYKDITYHAGYPGVNKMTGQLEVTNDTMFFYWGSRPREGSSAWGKSAFQVRLRTIKNVNWNEDARRMVGAAVATTLLLGPLGLLFLMGKKKSDYIKVEFQDPEAGRAGELLFQGTTGIGASIKAMLDMKAGIASRSDSASASLAIAPSSPAVAIATVQNAPRNAFLDRGNEFLRSGDAEAALKEFRKGNLINSRDTDILLGMATANEITGHHEAALGNIRRVLELDPQNIHANELLESMATAESDTETSSDTSNGSIRK